MFLAVPPQGAAEIVSGPDSVFVSLVGQSPIRVAPGDVMTLAFRVELSGSGLATLTPRFDMPAGWRSLRPQSEMTVRPENPVVRLVSIHVPDLFLAGSYDVTFSVSAPGQTELSASETVSVSVDTQYGLSMHMESTPPFVAAGKTVQAALTVFNDGNARASMALSWDGSDAGQLHLGAHSLELESGESAVVPISLTTNSDTEAVTAASYTITARIVDSPGIEDHVSIRTDIIPLYEKMATRGQPVPLALTMEAIGNERGTQPVAHISTAFDAFNGDVEVVGTLAGNSSQGLLGARDEFRISYTSEKVEVVVGDHAQNMSRLTTWGVYRLGASSRMLFNAWDVTLLGSRSRSYAPDDALAGVSVRRHLNTSSYFSANLFTRKGHYSGSIATLAYDWTPPGSRSLIGAECGLSGSGRLSDPSCRVETAYTRGPVQSRMEALSAATSLPGSQSGTRSFSESVRLKLLPGLQLEESFQVQYRNSDLGSNRVLHVAKLGVTYSRRIHATTWTTSVRATRDRIVLRTPDHRLSSESRVLRATTGLQRSRMGITATRDFGQRIDQDNRASPTHRTRLQARISPTRWLSISASGDRYSDFLISSRIRQQYEQYGIRAGVQLPAQLHVSVGGIQNRVTGRETQTYRSLTFQASKQFESGSRAFVQSQTSMSDGRSSDRKMEFRMGVTVPLGIPVPRSSDTSLDVLHGHVYHGDTGIPIEGVLLRYGSHLVISDAHGKFRIPKSMGHSEYLEVNQVSLPNGMVTLTEMPYLVGADAGTIDIPVVSAGSVSGHVARLGPPGEAGLLHRDVGSGMVEKERIVGAVIELRSDARSWRVRTDRNGSFTVRGVPAGSYVLRLLSADRLPAYHTFAEQEYSITVTGGAVTTRYFEAVPVKRTIRFQDTGSSGSLQLGSPSPPPAPAPDSSPSPSPSQFRGSTSSPRPIQHDADTLAASAVLMPVIPPVEDTAHPDESAVPAQEYDLSRGRSRDHSAASPGFVVPLPPVTPVAVLLWILSFLSYVIAADLVIRHVVRTRHTELGNISHLRDSHLLWYVRQCLLYALLLAGVVTVLGPLAGISTALALCAVSIAIESSSAIQLVVAMTSWRWKLRAANRFVVLFHGVRARDIKLSRSTVRLDLTTGESVVLNPAAMLGPAVTFLDNAQAVSLCVPVSRSANLATIRDELTTFMREHLHDGAQDSLHIFWEDVDSETTNVHVSAVTDRAVSQVQLLRQVTGLMAPHQENNVARIFHFPGRAA